MAPVYTPPERDKLRIALAYCDEAMAHDTAAGLARDKALRVLQDFGGPLVSVRRMLHARNYPDAKHSLADEIHAHTGDYAE